MLAHEHEHEWKRYVLRDVYYSDGGYRRTVKEYTEADFELIPDCFYVGYDCECSEQGYRW